MQVHKRIMLDMSWSSKADRGNIKEQDNLVHMVWISTNQLTHQLQNSRGWEHMLIKLKQCIMVIHFRDRVILLKEEFLQGQVWWTMSSGIVHNSLFKTIVLRGDHILLVTEITMSREKQITKNRIQKMRLNYLNKIKKMYM